MKPTRRQVLSAGGLAVVGSIAGCTSDEANGSERWPWNGSLPIDRVTQHHQPSCGCCGEYVEYLEENGIAVAVRPIGNPDTLAGIKRDLGVPPAARSCHTVEVGDYVVEGHVPLGAIEALFEAEPDVRGVTIPGMPQHAPGMGPPGEEPLSVDAFDRTGEMRTFLEDAR